MAPTEDQGRKSPIISALLAARKRARVDIRVHLSYRWFEKDAKKGAQRVFQTLDLGRSGDNRAVLLYLNPRKRIFSILADQDSWKGLGKDYFATLSKHLREDLLSTHFENALAIAVHTLSINLRKHFPTES